MAATADVVESPSSDCSRGLEHITVRGLDVCVDVRGDGPPLLLLSGLWSELLAWEPLMPYLQDFRTIAFDPPGIGHSMLPSRPFTMRGLAEFSMAVLEELGIERTHVLGASFGGAVAQQLTMTHSDRIDRLVLASTSYGGFALPGHPKAFWHFIQPSTYSSQQRLEDTAGAMFGGRLRADPELVRAIHLKRPEGLKAMLFRMVPLMGWTSLPWLHAIHHPTLLLAGSDDPVTPLINQRLMARLIPGATLRVVEGGGHLMLLDSPEQLGPMITEFLQA